MQRYCIRVPSEKSIPTMRLELQFPEALEVTAIEPPPGWRAHAQKDRAGRISGALWEGGEIAPRHSLHFGVLARNPDREMTLRWKAIQTYQDGSEVHWVGPARAQFPAAVTRIPARGTPSAQAACPPGALPSPASH